MTQEMVMILIFAAAIAAFGWIRLHPVKKRAIQEDAQVVVFEVTYHDRQMTLAFLERYFESNRISVLSVKRFVEGGEDEDLYTNEYKVCLPGSVTAAEVVSSLSGCATVQSVHARME